MNFMNRAWLYIVRKRGKSILLFVILLVMATFVLTALALGNASKAAQQELRQSLGGSFVIGFDYTENSPYLKVESVDGGTLMYSTQQISPELIEQIQEIEGIKECSATVEGLAAFPSLELFTGNIPIEEEFRASSKILSTWKSEELTRFTSGQLTLTQGRHILPDDKNKGLISKDLAEKNGLKIVDAFDFFWREQAHNLNLHAFVRLDFVTDFQAVFLSQILADQPLVSVVRQDMPPFCQRKLPGSKTGKLLAFPCA